MPSHLKKLVRARMAKTGESYQTALRHVRAQASAPRNPYADFKAFQEDVVDAAASVDMEAILAEAREGTPAWNVHSYRLDLVCDEIWDLLSADGWKQPDDLNPDEESSDDCNEAVAIAASDAIDDFKLFSGRDADYLDAPDPPAWLGSTSHPPVDSIADISRLAGVPPKCPMLCEVRFDEDHYEFVTMIGLDDEGEIILQFEDGTTEAGAFTAEEIFIRRPPERNVQK